MNHRFLTLNPSTMIYVQRKLSLFLFVRARAPPPMKLPFCIFTFDRVSHPRSNLRRFLDITEWQRDMEPLRTLSVWAPVIKAFEYLEVVVEHWNVKFRQNGWREDFWIQKVQSVSTEREKSKALLHWRERRSRKCIAAKSSSWSMKFNITPIVRNFMCSERK